VAGKGSRGQSSRAPPPDNSLIDQIFRSAKKQKQIEKQAVDPKEAKSRKLEQRLK
jgi:hypothetical protein